MPKTLSIITPCYNEEDSIHELCARIAATMKQSPYNYEHIFIDNCSTDATVGKIREMIAIDPHIRLIVNVRNFGQIRSPYHALMQARGDACVLLASDLQDPPEMISDFISKWEEGYKTVMAIKSTSDESFPLRQLKKAYYRFINRISETPLLLDATGTGLFDRCVVEALRSIDTPYPYFRGLVCEIGFPIAQVHFTQPLRKHGRTKNGFYTLYDYAMLGLTSHSKVPLRLMTMASLMLSLVSMCTAFAFLIAKMLFWNHFILGMAPVIIAMFFLASIQMFFLGVFGEYIGIVYTQTRKLPLVVEAERVNFPAEGP